MAEREAIRPVNPQRGIVLPISLLVLAILSLLGLAFLGMALTEGNVATNWRHQTQALYAAEGGLESGLVDLRAVLATTSAPTDAQLAGIAPRALADPGLAAAYAFDTFGVGRVRATPPYAYQTTIDSGPYRGLFAITTDYRISARVTGPRGSRAGLNQVVKHLEIPLFQFGVLYGRGVDLEIAPGPAMTFNGRVHANSNIYVVANAGLNFDSFMTTAGDIYRYLKRDASITRYNNPQIKDASGTLRPLNFDHDANVGFGGSWPVQDWRSTALSTYGGQVLDSAMGVQEIIPPIPDLFYNPSNPDVISHQLIEKGQASDSAEIQKAKLYYQADLRIVDGVATDKNGNPVSLPAGVVSTKTFYDKREEATMTVTEVDLGALRASGSAPASGVLYVSQTGSNKGVRLANGSELPSGGLTVVSENPVYVQGNYNTVNKVPAAVLADAITVLSNNWGLNDSDSKGDQVTDNRPATSTTVNAAFALGPSAESVVGQGNGQLENVIRFLENWSGDTITYNGSIIGLWHSQQATGAWRCCGSGGTHYYRAPNRNWSYDTLFNTSLPPGTPRGITILKGPWSQG